MRCRGIAAPEDDEIGPVAKLFEGGRHFAGPRDRGTGGSGRFRQASIDRGAERFGEIGRARTAAAGRQLEQHRHVDARDHFEIEAVAGDRERGVGGRVAEHVGKHDHAGTPVDTANRVENAATHHRLVVGGSTDDPLDSVDLADDAHERLDHVGG